MVAVLASKLSLSPATRESALGMTTGGDNSFWILANLSAARAIFISRYLSQISHYRILKETVQKTKLKIKLQNANIQTKSLSSL